LLLALLPSSAAFAQATPPDLADMVGARAGQAENELGRRGYRFIRAEQGDDRSYTYWWNSQRRQCVTIATMDGRYNSITATLAPDCQQERSRSDRGRTYRPYRSGVSESPQFDLTRLCRGEAATAFGRRPGEITTNQPIRQQRGSIVQGWFDAGGRTRFFSCRFDVEGRLLSIN
jgi:hypothetical protein